MIEFKVVPVPKPRMTVRDRWAKRPCVVRYFNFKDEVLRQAKKQKFTLGDKFEVIFIMPTKDAKRWGKPHQLRPDYDNLAKAFGDAMCKEDKTIWHVTVSKIWGKEGKIIVK